MKKILVINPKGGCGKTTVATNLASYYALWDVPVALIDYDPQGSSLEWVANRGRELGTIVGVDGSKGRTNLHKGIQRVLMDAPAASNNAQIGRFFQLADVVLIPVLPSPLDIRAVGHFIDSLLTQNLIKKHRVGLICNRVRENTRIYNNLRLFLRRQNLPLVTSLRDTQNYISAAEGGYGIFEQPPYIVRKDIEQWRPLIHWVES